MKMNLAIFVAVVVSALPVAFGSGLRTLVNPDHGLRQVSSQYLNQHRLQSHKNQNVRHENFIHEAHGFPTSSLVQVQGKTSKRAFGCTICPKSVGAMKKGGEEAVVNARKLSAKSVARNNPWSLTPTDDESALLAPWIQGVTTIFLQDTREWDFRRWKTAINPSFATRGCEYHVRQLTMSYAQAIQPLAPSAKVLGMSKYAEV